MDLFSWAPANLLGIEPNVVCHQLSIILDCRLLHRENARKGNKNVGCIRRGKNVVGDEFIQEIKYLTWLANIIMVKNK